MKIILHPANPPVPEAMTLQDFADKHGLVMEVFERSNPSEPGLRWYANFGKTEIVDGASLVGPVGNGETPEAAIAAYAQQIAGRVILHGGLHRAESKRIHVPPFLTYFPIETLLTYIPDPT